ncbi:hypothetical protein KRP22_014521 [Phytophthora ramorum]|nr:hypothetical protein KRP22_8876 [Phytophthora ramorum]
MKMKNINPLVIQSMSEDVIGVVLQRSRPTYQNFAEDPAGESVQVHLESQFAGIDELDHEAQRIRPTKDETAARVKRRERGRVNQARFRIRRKTFIVNLETRVQLLKQEIQQLQRGHDHIVVGAPTKRTLWVVAVEYFHIFRHGLHTAEGVHDLDMDFLRSSLASNMTTGTSTGLAVHLRCWRVFTGCFPDIRVELKHLGLCTETSLLAATTTTITITADSLRVLFPHLVYAPNYTRCSELVAKLQGQCLVIQGSVRFDWDKAINRVTGLYVQMDMVSPLLRILGSLEDVSLAFSFARITPDGNLVAREIVSGALCSF